MRFVHQQSVQTLGVSKLKLHCQWVPFGLGPKDSRRPLLFQKYFKVIHVAFLRYFLRLNRFVIKLLKLC